MRSIILILFILLLNACAELPKPPAAVPVYKITNVNVIDVLQRELKTGQTVTVSQGRIIAITDTDDTAHFEGLVIDGTNQYLIPGLWDSHAVVNRYATDIDYPLYIANGVTSVRSILNCPNEHKISIYACMETKQRWNQEVRSGKLVGPLIIGSGSFPVNGTAKIHPDLPAFYKAQTIKEAQEIIDYYAAFDNERKPYSIKVYNWLEPEVYHELVKQAKLKGFKISGHKPRKLTLEESIAAGQDLFAHARFFLYECSTLSAELIQGMHWQLPLPELYRLLLQTYDDEICAKKYEIVAKSRVAVSPTLLTRRNDYYSLAGKREWVTGIDYAHFLFEREWQEDIDKMAAMLQGPDDIAVFRAFYEKAAYTIGKAYQNGALILAGTDTYDTYVVPGFSIHEELYELYKAGIDPFGVLQAATINNAIYFGMDSEVGSITQGKVADMVLLNANPLADIRNSADINMVFHGQYVYDSSQIDNLKQRAKTVAESHAFTLKMLWSFLKNPKGF